MVKPRPAAVSQADKLRRFKYLEVTTLANKLRKRLREDTIKPAPILLTPPQVQCKKCPGCLHKTCGECKACKQKQRCTAPERRCTGIPDDILSCTSGTSTVTQQKLKKDLDALNANMTALKEATANLIGAVEDSPNINLEEWPGMTENALTQWLYTVTEEMDDLAERAEDRAKEIELDQGNMFSNLGDEQYLGTINQEDGDPTGTDTSQYFLSAAGDTSMSLGLGGVPNLQYIGNLEHLTETPYVPGRDFPRASQSAMAGSPDRLREMAGTSPIGPPGPPGRRTSVPGVTGLPTIQENSPLDTERPRVNPHPVLGPVEMGDLRLERLRKRMRADVASIENTIKLIEGMRCSLNFATLLEKDVEGLETRLGDLMEVYNELVAVVPPERRLLL